MTTLLGQFMFTAALSMPQAQPATGPVATRDTVLRFAATDGTPLEARLTLPSDPRGPVPVVFYLHGAGPRTYDHAVQYRDSAGAVQVIRYYDTHATELARRGLGFFRMSKRGVSAAPSGRPQVERAVFSTATPTVLLGDYVAALALLRAQPEVDAGRIVLYGSSEGTRLAPQLARRAPDGIVGLVLTSYAADNQHQTVVWQNTVGIWRNVTAMIPEAANDTITLAEWQAAAARLPRLNVQLPFASVDVNRDSLLTREELTGLVRPRLDAILRAVETRNDDFLWQNLLNLTSAYLLDGWDGPPTADYLLQVPLPVAIVHGSLDGATRVEGVEETAARFQAAGRRDLTVRVFPGLDHDLGWTPAGAAAGALPPPFAASFDAAAGMARRN